MENVFLNPKKRVMKSTVSIFKVFQQGDEFFEVLSSSEKSLTYVIKQLLLIILFTFLYGIVMGSYNGFLQAFVTSIKLPVLVLLSIAICFPAFYVIQFMLGSKMSFYQMSNVILAGFVVFSTIMVSFAPIVIFFMITGNNYAFLKLLHVAIFVFSGIFSIRTIINGLKFSCEKKNVYPKLGINIFKIWIFIFAFVSMQLAWNLRPFVGSKNLPFELFREKEGNFYLAVITSISDLNKKTKDIQSTDEETVPSEGIAPARDTLSAEDKETAEDIE
jgi:hypothetical protein